MRLALPKKLSTKEKNKADLQLMFEETSEDTTLSKYQLQQLRKQKKQVKRGKTWNSAKTKISDLYKKGKESKIAQRAHQTYKTNRKRAHYAKKHPFKASYKGTKKAVQKNKALIDNANHNLKAARGQILQEKGFKGLFSIRYISLLFTSVTLSRPIPILIVLLVFGFICQFYFYNSISLTFGAYVLKALPCALLNAILTIGNALWFAIHALKEMAMLAYVHVLNVIFNYFLTPVIDFTNMIASYIPWFPKAETLDISTILLDEGVHAMPNVALSYVYPKPVFWGDWGSLSTFMLVKPGVEVYSTPWIISTIDMVDAHSIFDLPPGFTEQLQNIVEQAQMQAILEGYEIGDASYILSSVQNGASVWAPQYNNAAIAPGWLSPIDNTESFVKYTFADYSDKIIKLIDFSSAKNIRDIVADWLFNGPLSFLDGLRDTVGGLVETVSNLAGNDEYGAGGGFGGGGAGGRNDEGLLDWVFGGGGSGGRT